MIKLGDQVTDVVTGFTGVVTGKCEYLTGCRQFLVVARIGADSTDPAAHAPTAGDIKSQWFDETRLDGTTVEQLAARVAVPVQGPNGGPQETPPRRC